MQPKFCTKCGNALKEGDKFCRKCGAPVRIKSVGTVPGSQTPEQSNNTVKKARIVLSLDEMLGGCTKIVDFGTGKRFELEIPAGISPGNTILVKDTGIIDPISGEICDIELTTILD